MCNHDFIVYDGSRHPDCFVCKECGGTWEYHPKDKIALDALVSKIMCNYQDEFGHCDNFCEENSKYCEQHAFAAKCMHRYDDNSRCQQPKADDKNYCDYHAVKPRQKSFSWKDRLGDFIAKPIRGSK